MTIAEDIMALVQRKRRLSLTAKDIAEMRFAQKAGYQQRVNSDCVLLVRQGRSARKRNGGPRDPYTYHLPTR